MSRSLAIAILISPAVTFAQPADTAADDHTELAKLTQNPIADLVSVPLQFNFNSGGGLEDRSNLILNVQPVIPINVTRKWNVIARTILPIANVPTADGGNDTGLGDVQLELFLASAGKGALLWGIGPVFSFPTATSTPLTTGSWAVGPAGVLVLMTGPWVLGALATQTWTFADFGDDREVTALMIQPFVNFNLRRGWALVSAPIITSDWDLDGDGWTIPAGGGVSWTTTIGSQPMTLGVQYYFNLEHPDAGPRNQLRFTLSFLFPKELPGAAGRSVAQTR